MPTVTSGLEGIVAAETRLSRVDGQAGELVIAGFPVEELARNATFEETVYLLWNDRLPTAAELSALRDALATRRTLPEASGLAAPEDDRAGDALLPHESGGPGDRVGFAHPHVGPVHHVPHRDGVVHAKRVVPPSAKRYARYD